MKRLLLVLPLLLLFACEEGDSPTDPGGPSVTGNLSGLVAIGPNCPAAQGECPTPLSAYDARKILVFDSGRTRQLFTVDIDSRGFYFIRLAPGDYVIDLRGLPNDRSEDVPKTISIRANLVTRVDIRVDTGIR